MKLLTQAIRNKLPPLGATDGQGGQTIVWAKFFTPDAGWSFYPVEYDGEDTFFGLVDGLDRELGYFSLAELRRVRGPLGLAVERDRYWEPKPLKQIAPDLFEENQQEARHDRP